MIDAILIFSANISSTSKYDTKSAMNYILFIIDSMKNFLTFCLLQEDYDALNNIILVTHKNKNKKIFLESFFYRRKIFVLAIINPVK